MIKKLATAIVIVSLLCSCTVNNAGVPEDVIDQNPVSQEQTPPEPKPGSEPTPTRHTSGKLMEDSCHYDVNFPHPVTGENLGTASIDIDFTYDFMSSEIKEHKITYEMAEGYDCVVSVSESIFEGKASLTATLMCTEKGSGDTIAKHKIEYRIHEDGAVSNVTM